MTAKIRELNLDDIKNVAGGALALSTYGTPSTSTSASIAKPAMTASWSVSTPTTTSALARRF